MISLAGTHLPKKRHWLLLYLMTIAPEIFLHGIRMRDTHANCVNSPEDRSGMALIILLQIAGTDSKKVHLPDSNLNANPLHSSN